MVADAGRHLYLDASALVKLIVAESESDALRSFLDGSPSIVSSRLAAVEVRRVAARQIEHDTDAQVSQILDSVFFIELDVSLAEAAGAVPPPSLRSLDAIHLASAESLAEELAALVTYDHRLADAARARGLQVEAPA